ncbi:MAG: chemotaxis protein CheB [Gallionella sp.]|nr:chemotaxis protein CheB [Gallionella sp.]
MNKDESAIKGVPLPQQHYVGIGASAGGLEAITAFFKNMPTDTGLIYIVIQHLSPDYKSMMDELLSKVTDIPVEVVKDGTDPLPDHIYLIPPQKNMTIFHGKLLLESQDRSHSMLNLPIDLFLNSLAEDQGRNAIGIILSGTGSDGTRGCRAIKEAGGLVMAQSESSAKFEGMPKNVIANGLADFILPAENLPEQLLRFVQHPLAARGPELEQDAGDKSALSKIFAMLRSKTKIDFTYYKPPTITRRIERRISINQVRSIEEYVDYLNQHPAEITALYRELLIGVTNFYRDTEVFDTLQAEHLKSYIRSMEGHELRIWVAGCSTGEEAYTYCMLVQDIAEELGKAIDLKLFATDIDQESLNRASQGFYPESIAADLPQRFLNKYFIRKDDLYQVSRQLREMVVFARHDLIKDPPFTNIDLVSCRNLLIYLQPILQRRIFDGFNFSLRPHGLLVLGSSESLGEAEPYFETLEHRCKIFRSRGNRKSLLNSERFRLPEPANTHGEWAHTSRTQFQNRNADDARILESFIEALAIDFIPVSMIVDEGFELLRVTGDSRRYLRPLSGKVSTDITKILVKELGVPIATGLTKVFKSRTEVSFSNVSVKSEDVVSKVNILIRPLVVRRNTPLLAVVIISEVAKTPSTEIADGVKYDADAEVLHRLGDLEQELQFTRESLQATIEELETSNEELQATNEELLASNEELQSTNEELQSVNEELFTVNAEYQGKISELSELNADMENFMAASRLVALFLDTGLNIRRFTRNAKSLFNILDHDINRPFEHISHRLKNADLIALARQTLISRTSADSEVQAEDGDWYHMRVRPYMLNHDIQGGVMIVLYEINELKAAQEKLLQMHQRTVLAQTLTLSATWDWDLSTNVMEWSDNTESLLGLPDGSLEHTSEDFMKSVRPDDRLPLQACMENAIKTGKPYTIQYRVEWPDGTEHRMEQRGAVLKDEQGKAIHLLGVIHSLGST